VLNKRRDRLQVSWTQQEIDKVDDFRSSLMHLSLEGVMQAKQRSVLSQLWE